MISVLLILFSAGSACAQQFNAARLDSLFAILDRHDRFMGSIAVMQNGALLYSKTIGKDDVQAGKQSTAASKYRIGSVSKMFTAALVLKAIEEKMITLEEPILVYFPQIEAARKITVEDLLSHRSGLYDFTADPYFTEWNTTPKSPQEMISIIASGPSNFEPGSKSDYSNSNYVLLSYILEKIYKKPYKEILGEKITTPLALRNTYFGGKTDIEGNETYSYHFSDVWEKETETDLSIPMGAGAVVSCPHDLDLFISRLFEGKIISGSSLAKMTAIREGYGLGVFEFPVYDKKAFGHTGAIDGFSSILLYFPDNKLSVAVISNGKTYPIEKVAKAAVGTYYNKPVELPEFKTVALKTEDIDPYLGDYASATLPLVISVTKQGTKIVLALAGQPPLYLAATEKDTFENAGYQVTVKFTPAAGKMVLTQGGRELVLVRKTK